MIDIEGVKVNESSVNYIKVVRKGLPILNGEDNRSWTIMVNFINGEFIHIGDYSTKGYAQDRLNEMRAL